MAKKKKSIGKKLRKFSLETRLKAAEKFKEKVLEKFGEYIKTIIVWGSVTRGDYTGKSDVDIYIIFDDTKYSLKSFDEVRDKINADIAKIAKSIDPRISVQPIIALTEFIDEFRMHHPLFYNIVREGYAIYDTGFFIPMRKLLEFGHFPLTKEAAMRRLEPADSYLERAKSMISRIILVDIYHAILDSTQGLLMYLGVEPPAPKNTPEVAKKYLLKSKLLNEEDIRTLEDIIKFYKGFEHGESKKAKGKDLDEWIERAEKYVKKIKEIFRALEARHKEEEVKKGYEVMIKSVVMYLDSIGKLPKDPKELPKAFEEEMIKSKKVPEFYKEVFRKIIEMRKLVEEKKFDEINDRELNLTKEYIRRFAIAVNNMIKEIEKKEDRQKKKDGAGKKQKTRKTEKDKNRKKEKVNR